MLVLLRFTHLLLNAIVFYSDGVPRSSSRNTIGIGCIIERVCATPVCIFQRAFARLSTPDTYTLLVLYSAK